MSQAVYNKKARTARASQQQLTKMIDYFYMNKGLAEGRIHSLHGKEEAQKRWTELANELNACRGTTKTVEQWQVVWRDLKSRTSIKVKDLRKAKALTGNKPITQSELTEFEQRVIGLIGAEYVEGSKYCADSIPEEEDLLQELEHGNNNVLSATPQVISICTDISQEISEKDSQYSYADVLNNDLVLEDDCSLDMNFLLQHNETGNTAAVKNINNKLNTITEQCNRIKSSEQLHSLRVNFESIAQKQADAEMIHAESAKIQAEASKMNALAITEIAHAVQKIADTAAIQVMNDSKRIEIFEKLTIVLENLLPTYLKD